MTYHLPILGFPPGAEGQLCFALVVDPVEPAMLEMWTTMETCWIKAVDAEIASGVEEGCGLLLRTTGLLVDDDAVFEPLRMLADQLDAVVVVVVAAAAEVAF